MNSYKLPACVFADTEFMCDYCELIFTTKEKLDDHISFSHEDELRSEVSAII